MTHWMRPGNFTHATVTVDPRVGGGFRIVMEGRTPKAVEAHRKGWTDIVRLLDEALTRG